MNWSSLDVYWYALPLVAAISLVYAATRHESWPAILRHAVKLAGSILLAMVLATIFLFLLNTQTDG